MIDYDEQVLESVSVRRQRLLHALLFGDQRRRRRFDDGLKLALISAILGVIACAGCIGYSFIIDLFAGQQERLGAWAQAVSQR